MIEHESKPVAMQATDAWVSAYCTFRLLFFLRLLLARITFVRFAVQVINAACDDIACGYRIERCRVDGVRRLVAVLEVDD